jgi:hypothetical protein
MNRGMLNRGMLLIESVRLGARLLDLLERTARRRIRRAIALAFSGGAGLGAALMYLLDPERGRRRRKLLSDQIVHLVSQSDDVINSIAFPPSPNPVTLACFEEQQSTCR